MSRILNRERVRLTDSGIMVGCGPETHLVQPSVVLRRDGVTGRIDQLEVTCSCGEILVIDCRYDEVSAPATRVEGTQK
jgi:hypothetical protein